MEQQDQQSRLSKWLNHCAGNLCACTVGGVPFVGSSSNSVRGLWSCYAAVPASRGAVTCSTTIVQLRQLVSCCADSAAAAGGAQVDWFFTREQEASTEALAHRWDPAGSAAVARLESFLEQVRGCWLCCI
jgi:hypothetical protein